MTIFKKYSSLYIGILLLAAIAILHAFFINSDPDTNADPATRGAFTDEALYSMQSRNYVVSNEFSLTENDTWIQGPVYGALQIAAYKIFGVRMSVARTITIAAMLLILLFSFWATQTRKIILCLAAFGFTEFHLFSFSHYALPYMISLSMVVLGAILFVHAVTSERRSENIKFSVLCVIALLMAFAVKVSFFYAFFIPLLSSLLLFLLERKPEQKVKKRRTFVILLIVIAIAMLVYVALWYLPHKSFFDYVVFGHVEALIPGTYGEIMYDLKFNFMNRIWGTHLRYIFLLFTASAIAAGYLLHERKFTNSQKALLVFALAWILIETHRFAMWYLPFRYILGLIISCFLFMSVVAVAFWENMGKLRYLLIIPVLMVFYVNGKDYAASYSSRTTVISEANKYFSSVPFNHKNVIGAWAPCLNWESDAKVLPVWDKYLHYKDPVKSYSPVAIVAEAKEDDSNQAFVKQGVQLNEISDSLKMFKIGAFQVNVFWLKKVH